ncbi:hypothetical protein Ac2012v2_003526 [Leucoagaricus gongylophorus]
MSLAGENIHIGVVLFPQYQLLDAAGPIDYINSHSHTFCSFFKKDSLIPKATTIHWSYIAETLDLVQPSSGPAQQPTHTFSNPPPDDQLDYLIVPGADPTKTLSPACIKFFQVIKPKVKAMLLVCVASLLLAQTGILDGHRICSNKYTLKEFAGLGMLKKEVAWVGDRRWIIDGNVWSCGGITGGIDLAAEFARMHFHQEMTELVKAISEWTPRPEWPDEWAKLVDGVNLGGYRFIALSLH